MTSRLDNNFKFKQLDAVEREEFLDEMFAELFDLAPIDSDTDRIPDFSKLPEVA